MVSFVLSLWVYQFAGMQAVLLRMLSEKLSGGLSSNTAGGRTAGSNTKPVLHTPQQSRGILWSEDCLHTVSSEGLI
jgi:hypothetical protein